MAKRYRYTGKERDEESGLYYHGARYYIPWLARWSAVDPLESKYAGWSSYNYGFDNPVKWNDLSGMGPGDEEKTPTVDNTAVKQTPITYNLFSAPDGGILTLPTTAKVESTFTGGKAQANGAEINPLEGSVWTFSYKDEVYGAQFNRDGAFTGYQSFTNPDHRLGVNENTTPKVDPNASSNRELGMAIGLASSSTQTRNPYLILTGLILSGIVIGDALSDRGKTVDLPVGLSKPNDITSPVAIPIPLTNTKTDNTEKLLYRFDTRNPLEILKDGGFKSWGQNMDLFDHAFGTSIDNKTSGYVSTSKDLNALMKKIDENAVGYIYTIKWQPKGIDVNQALGWKSPFPSEQEVAVPLYINALDIQSFSKFGKK
ncbi:MAG TPA: RHS repeat-associated core domain-containing protein [Flavipsychrobacter sp.]|nr:RHS repeat-associated core domain-containing protein [Flavipsychrobacter sp.]